MEIDFKQVGLQIVNFGILFFFLKKLLYEPILNVLKQREDKINEGLAAAEKNIKAEEEIDKKVKSEVAKARREAAKITKESEAAAKEKASLILSDAKKEAKEESKKLEKKVAAQMSEQEKALQAQVGGLVVETTKNVLADVLSSKDVERITKATINNLR